MSKNQRTEKKIQSKRDHEYANLCFLIKQPETHTGKQTCQRFILLMIFLPNIKKQGNKLISMHRDIFSFQFSAIEVIYCRTSENYALNLNLNVVDIALIIIFSLIEHL